MQAFILAGGRGVRLQPYTMVFPKPMLPIGGMPIIEIIVRQLAYYGFGDITISLGYLGDYIKLYFKDGAKTPRGAVIKYVEEVDPLGTAGSICLLDKYDNDFLVLNGDLLTSIDFRDFFNFHKSKGAALSIAVGVKSVRMNLGILEMKGENVIDFKEKPTFSYNDNMGIYIYNKRVLDYIERGKRLDVNDLILRLLQNKEKVLGYRSEKSYYWVDIGQHADYELANNEFENNRKDFLKE